MHTTEELEYKALAMQTGTSGISISEQKMKYYNAQTGKNGTNPYVSEMMYLQMAQLAGLA